MSIQMVQVMGVTSTLIGDLQQNNTVLKRPRATLLTPLKDQPGKYVVDFLTLLGEPEHITLHNISYSYPASARIAQKYLEAVTGLTLAGNGVTNANH